ncbi:MAG: hypothetical protein ACKPB7_11630 [Sphaerospermopsis kisseleviana]
MVIFFIFGRTTVYFPFTVLPFFRYIFRTGLINTLIQTSLEEHRAIKYVERISFGKLPPYISNFHDDEE